MVSAVTARVVFAQDAPQVCQHFYPATLLVTGEISALLASPAGYTYESCIARANRPLLGQTGQQLDLLQKASPACYYLRVLLC